MKGRAAFLSADLDKLRVIEFKKGLGINAQRSISVKTRRQTARSQAVFKSKCHKKMHKTMSSTKAGRVFKLTARGNPTYSSVRKKLMRRLIRAEVGKLENVSDYQFQKVFELKNDWKLLDFGDIDWKLLEHLEKGNDFTADQMFQLVWRYISTNIDRVERLDNLAKVISDAILTGDESLVETKIVRLDNIDKQSLLAMRLMGAHSTGNHEILIDYLKNKENSFWVRSSFLYPFVYHAVNQPIDHYLDAFLSYTVPHENYKGIERTIIRFVLRDDLPTNLSLVIKLYMCLMCHPYDAIDFLSNHFELEIAQNGDLKEESKPYFEKLMSMGKFNRMGVISRMRSTQKKNFISGTRQENDVYFVKEQIPTECRQIITAMLSMSSTMEDAGKLISIRWERIARMRWSRYPTHEDFDYTTNFLRMWRFIEVGRLFDALMTTMYMFPRRVGVTETRCILRLLTCIDAINTYMISSPSGTELISDPVRFGLHSALIFDHMNCLTAISEDNDRTWFHAIHWKLREPREAIRIREWLSIARDNFPVAPSYLTGIDWDWIEEILPKTRVRPFSDNANGPYVLLLRETEEQSRDATLLRTSIEPFAANKNCEQFVEWLIEEYDIWAVGFVRFLLTPENIVLLRLAPNMTAALSERISALEKCTQIFKFNDLLSEAQLRKEQQTLSSSLMLLNVNPNQFEIPWDSFSRDVSERLHDQYKTYLAMKGDGDVMSPVSDRRSVYPHQFSNGVVVHYNMLTSQAALAHLIFQIIDCFIDHPSYGIEAILSTRFRHDTLRREYASTFQNIKETHIPGVMHDDQSFIVDHIAETVLSVLDKWLVIHAQTEKAAHPYGLFNFVPTPEEINNVSIAENHAEFEPIVAQVVSWLRKRLEHQLEKTRFAFKDDYLKQALQCLASPSKLASELPLIDLTIIERVAAAVSSALVRRTDELTEWFRTSDPNEQKSLTFKEIKMAVEGRFETHIRTRALTIDLSDCEEARRNLTPANVKLYFDLLSEIVQNTLKYCKERHAKIRIRPLKTDDWWGFLYSSNTSRGEPFERVVQGHRYISLSDSLFREGNSGLSKIGAISASILGNNIEVTAKRRRYSFHLPVPLGINH